MNITDAKLNEWMALNVGGWEPRNELSRECERPSPDFWFRVNPQGKGERYPGNRVPNYCHDGNLMLEVMEWLFARGWRICGEYDSDSPPWIDLHRVREPWLPDGEVLCRTISKAVDFPRALCELCHEAREKGWL